MFEPFVLKPLGELADLRMGGTPSRAEPDFWDRDNAGHPWVSIGDLRGEYISRTKESVTKLGARAARLSAVPPGVPIMSFKLSMGRAAIPTVPVYTNEAIVALFPKSGISFAKWLYYSVPRVVQSAVTETAVKGQTLNLKKLRELLIPTPYTLEEQRRIAEILDSVDEYIATASAILDKREKVRIGIISDLINSYGSQGMVRLRDVGSIGSGSTPSRGRSDYWVNGTIPWVKTAEVAFSVITDTAEHVTASAVRDCRLSVYPAGTVLVAMYGEGATRGRSAILGVPATVNQACAAITCDTKTLSPEYLFECLKHLYGEIRLLGHGSNQTNLNAEMLGELEVPAPSLEEQEKLTAVMRDFDRESFVLAETLSKARAIKQGLAEDLLTGRVRVPEAEAVVESL